MKAIDQDALRRIIFFIDGLSYTFAMSKLAVERLRKTLSEVEADPDGAEALKVSALLDAWTIIDAAHRARELIQELRGYSVKNRAAARVFLNSTTAVEDLRNFVQHLRSQIKKIPSPCPPLWGALNWISGDKHTTFIMIPGNLQPGIESVTVSWDWDEGRFTADLVLFAGDFRVELGDVVDQMLLLRDDLQNWIAEQPWTSNPPSTMKTWLLKWSIPRELAEKRKKQKSRPSLSGR